MDIDPEECLVVSLWLAGRLSGLFPKWSHHELLSEIYVMYNERIDRWDQRRGGLASFGLGTFKDPLMARYLKDQGIRVRRSRGKPREYLWPKPLPLDMSCEDSLSIDFPWHIFTPRERGFIQMKVLGMTATGIGLHESISQPTMCSLFKKIKDKLSWSFMDV